MAGDDGAALAGDDSAALAGDDSIAGRLATKLCQRRPSAGLVAALRAALVLAADHELAASTLAARVAASVRADPYAVVGTGLGTMSGALHGGASLGAEVLLASASRPTRRAWSASCCAEGSGFPGSAISCTRPATRGPCCCST